MASAENCPTVDLPRNEGELHTQNNTPSLRDSEVLCVEEEEDRYWDLNDENAVEGDDAILVETTLFTKAVKLIKVVVYLVTFGIVLFCAVVSKGTFLFMTSVIGKDRRFSTYNITGLEKDKKYLVQLSTEERLAWIWCLLFVLLVPEILTFYRSTRLCIFKQFQKPKISSFLTVMVTESLHVVGLVLMIFVAFPKLHVMKALSLTNAVCVLPSFLYVFSSWSSQNTVQSRAQNILNLAALVGQTSVCAWAASNSNTAEAWAAVSAILVSFSWWENFVGQNSPKWLRKTSQDIEKSRNFIYVFISLWKIVLIFSLCLAYLSASDEDVKSFLSDMPSYFKSHNVSALWPEIKEHIIPDIVTPPSKITIPDLTSSAFLPAIVAGIHIASSFLCYSCGKFVCKICIQGFSYALPIGLTVPLTMGLLSTACRMHKEGSFSKILPYLFWDCPQDQWTFFEEEIGFIWILWLLSQIWITIHLWFPQCERMASTNKLFVNPMYCTVLIDQSLALNRRKEEKAVSEKEALFVSDEPESTPRIFACATMWHETPDEMEQLLKSIMRMDVHQCSQRTIQDGLVIRNPDYYEMEAHIFFDDAFVISDEDDEKMTINNFVKDLIVTVETAASKVYKNCAKPDPPIKVPTPYGGRLIWRLLGDNALVVHVKNKDLIRHKKRWSQVMYMYYLLGYRLESTRMYNDPSVGDIHKNTFILALDGDIDFKPNAVQLLVDLMNRNKGLGAACGRIHPIGTGLMVYYQKFEYAIGHWLQKATEHMIGCVLCSPGCFSLFRAEALIKNNTVRRYATQSKEAIEYVQFDQGEDRWLCTLLLQRGYRVEYSAASDAYTHCPESFAEFYTQRRRWGPSTLANIMDLLVNYRKTVECNDNISRPYIAYQVLLMMGTILGPGTIFLMLVGAMVSAFGISNWQSFIANMVPIVFFILICFLAKNDTQIFVAEVFSALYALLMMAVLVGISLQLVVDGITSPGAIFILAMTASFIIAAMAHPQEFWCVAHGLLYFMSVPSMYLLLALYSFINLHVVSWGTREVQTKMTKKQMEAELLRAQVAAVQKPTTKSGMFDWVNMLSDKGHPEDEGSISFSFANLFRCMCCTYPKPDPSSLHMIKVEAHLKDINSHIHNLQRQIESSSRVSGFRRRSSLHALQKDSHLNPVSEDEDIEEEDEIYDEQRNDEQEEHTYNQPDNQEHWLTDPVLKKSVVKRLSDEENIFWTELIDTYLYPLIEDPEDKAKVSRQLIELRNKVVFGILMLNALFILIVFLLQMQKDTLHIEWPLNGKANITYLPTLVEIRIEMEYLKLEPINLVLVFFFTLILVIQFIGMLFHRLETLSHILSSTTLIDTKAKDTEEINFSQLTDLLQKQGLRDDDEIPLITVEEDRSELTNGPPPPFRENGFLPNRLSEGGSLCEERIRGKVKFRSLSVAFEQDLQRIIERDPKFAHKVRRMSRNPDALGALKRKTSAYNLGTPASTRAPTPRTDTMSAGIAGLDSAFGTPSGSVRRSFFNPAFQDSFDTESVNSIHMMDMSTIRTSASRNALINTDASTSSLKRKLNKIKDDTRQESRK